MAHHLNKNGDFQSDKFPELAPNKIVLSFKDSAARKALGVFIRETTDRELAADIETVLKNKFHT